MGIAAGAHYVDLSGEATDYALIAALDDDATNAGIMLMPGVGFGVVPTDCLARFLVDQLPDAPWVLNHVRITSGEVDHPCTKVGVRHHCAIAEPARDGAQRSSAYAALRRKRKIEVGRSLHCAKVMRSN